MDKMMKVVDEMIKKRIMECASKYNFDGEEAIREMSMGGSMSGSVSVTSDISIVKKNKKNEKKEKKEKKVNIPLPFSREAVRESGCQGLKYNHGLFSQCENERLCQEEEYCDVCKKETSLTENRNPYCGKVSDRLKVGLMEYRDRNGRKPIGYLEVLKNKNINKDEAIEYMDKIEYKYDKMHLETDKKEGRRGRPKKEGKEVLVSDVEDLFAKLAIDSSSISIASAKKEELFAKLETEPFDMVIVDDVSIASDSNLSALTLDSSASASESKKEAKKAKKAEKEAKKAEIEEKKAKKAAELAEKEAKKTELAEKKAKKESELAEKEAKKAEIEEKKAKKAAELAEKEAKKAAELAEKEAEKEAKKANDKAEKEAKKIAEKETKKEVKEVKNEEPVSEEPTKVKVKRIEIDGKLYLLSNTNILYDPDTKDEMGIYDEATKTIKELPDDEDSEIEEEEYDEDSDDE